MGKPTKPRQRAAIETDSGPALIDGKSGKPLPTPRPRHIRLRSINDCRAEAEKVYRDMRSEKIEPQAGTRLVYVLSQIVGMIEAGEFEERLTALEQSRLLEES
jgi:hypothetical protein